MKKLFNLLLNTSFKRRLILLSVDVLCFLSMNIMYLLFASVGTADTGMFWLNTGIHIFLICIFRTILRVYKNVWRYSNTGAYLRLIVADGIAGVATIFITYFIGQFIDGMYIGVWRALSVSALTAILTLLSRFCYSIAYKVYHNSRNKVEKEPIAIIKPVLDLVKKNSTT